MDKYAQIILKNFDNIDLVDIKHSPYVINQHSSLDTIYCEDDDLLFNSYLNNKFFINEKNTDDSFVLFPGGTCINLIVRPECNQTCEYCYIYKFGKELYPIEQRVDNKTILKNIKALFEYFNKRKCYVPKWDMFAGDLFYDNFWFDLMDIFYDYFKEITNKPEIMKSLQANNLFCSINNPSNCSFCHDKEKVMKVQQYIDKFRKINVYINFSYSHDGYYSMDVREKQQLSQDYYDTIFNFMARNHYGGHPMISYEGIDNSIQNYEWWKEQYSKYGICSDPVKNDFIPMFLEVRNNGWSKDNIQSYVKLLDYMFEDRLKMCGNDKHALALNLFNKRKEKEANLNDGYKIKPLHNNDLIRLMPQSKHNTKITCSVGHAISIKASNLTIVPCHRMAYPYFEAAQFVYDNKNEKITKVQIKNNVDAYYAMTNGNHLMNPKCAACEYNYFCIKGCLGSQYETFGDYNIPIPNICELMQAKTDFLFKKYHDTGLFKIYFENLQEFADGKYNEASRYLEFLLYKGYKEYERYAKNS